ncbi:MAG: hypothetical protein R2707_14610 [Acidimicrobiales bacterium]
MSSRLLRLAGPAVAVVVVGAAIGWFPARSDASQAEARTESALRLVDDLTWEIDDLDVAVSSVDELRDEQARHAAEVPPDLQLAEFILDLEALSIEVGIDLVDIIPTSTLNSFDDLATPVGTSSVIIAVALNGGFAETIRFLDGLSHLPRLVVAEAIAVGFDEVSGTLAIDLELRVFTTDELVPVDDELFDEFDDAGLDEFDDVGIDEGSVS